MLRLFAFGRAHRSNIALVARVSNAGDHAGSQFDTGSYEQRLAILQAVARAGREILET